MRASNCTPKWFQGHPSGPPPCGRDASGSKVLRFTSFKIPALLWLTRFIYLDDRCGLKAHPNPSTSIGDIHKNRNMAQKLNLPQHFPVHLVDVICLLFFFFFSLNLNSFTGSILVFVMMTAVMKKMQKIYFQISRFLYFF